MATNLMAMHTGNLQYGATNRPPLERYAERIIYLSWWVVFVLSLELMRVMRLRLLREQLFEDDAQLVCALDSWISVCISLIPNTSFIIYPDYSNSSYSPRIHTRLPLLNYSFLNYVCE